MGRQTVFWENVSVGLQIPELVVCPDHAQLFMFSAVTWNRHQIHYSQEAARRDGLPDIVVQRALIGNFLARMLLDWAGDRAVLRRLAWKVTRSALVGHEIICRGRVADRTDSGDARSVRCDVTAADIHGECIAAGDALLVFP